MTHEVVCVFVGGRRPFRFVAFVILLPLKGWPQLRFGRSFKRHAGAAASDSVLTSPISKKPVLRLFSATYRQGVGLQTRFRT
jgi:hypothetical protein